MLKTLSGLLRNGSKAHLVSHGHCPTCNQEASFVAHEPWLRDHFLCTNCGSIPRERALMETLIRFYPNWQELVIHESSPVCRGASVRLARECRSYIPSQFFAHESLGSVANGVRCENLEALSFADESIDLHISQDVMEHLFNPAQAFKEIARTLKPGGAHIFTVPLVKKREASVVRARMGGQGGIDYLEPPEYHGNPVDPQGSLVTMDWGYDIARSIFEASGLFTQLVFIDDLSKGIRADYIEVLVTLKPGATKDCYER